MDDPLDGTLTDAVDLLQSQRLSSRELTEASLTRIAERDGILRAWEQVHVDDALEQADQADRRLTTSAIEQSGPPHPLCGIPIGLKDVIAIKDKPLTAGSRALYDNVPAQDADVVQRLRTTGAVLLGHTRSQEFAAGRSPQTAANPWNPAYSPGGSSNGSGAAVGGRTVLVALGTDTAGSIRRPASACGLSTVMGTYGSVSNEGIISTGTNFTQIGPLTTTALDAALVFSSLAKAEVYDPHTPDAGISRTLRDGTIVPTSSRRPLEGRRIGVLTDFSADVAPSIGDLFQTLLEDLVALGAELLEIASPMACPPNLYPVPELIAFHRELFPARGHLYSPHQRELVADSLERAGTLTAVALHDAMVDRATYSRAWADRFETSELDAVVCPSQVAETPALGEDPEHHNDLAGFGPADVRQMWNVAGFPVVGVQMGLTSRRGLPVGAQLIGRPWTEHVLLQLAVDLQHHTAHHQLRPTLDAAG